MKEPNTSSNYFKIMFDMHRYINPAEVPYDVKGRLQFLFEAKKRYFYEELVIWMKDLFKNAKEMDEALLKNTKIIQEKLSRACYEGFSSTFKPYVNNIIQDKNSNGSFYYVKFYVSKYN